MILLRSILFLGLAMAWFSTSVTAEPHRFTAGDEITVGITGQPPIPPAQIDRDGWLRLPGVVQLPLRGLTIDGAQAAITRALIDDAALHDPQVILSVNRYAPITIGGDVARAGTFDYMPNMTAQMAYAVAGGARETSAANVQETLNYLETRATMTLIEQDRDQALQRVILFASVLARDLPQGVTAQTTRLQIAQYQHTLSDAQSHWVDQIEQIGRLIDGLEQRLVFQDRIIASRQTAAQTALDLADRQLRTAATAESAELLLLEAQARRLDLEQIISEAALQMAALRREKQAQYDSVRLDWAERLQLARRDYDRAQLQHEAAQTRLSYLEGLMNERGGEGAVTYLITRYTPDGMVQIEGDNATQVNPGDAIFVSRVSRGVVGN